MLDREILPEGSEFLLGTSLAEDKNKTQLSISRRALEVAYNVFYPISVTSLKFRDVTSIGSVVLIACLSILFIQNRNICQKLKSPVAYIRKLLLMNDYDNPS